jgi:hypothetical protein
MKGVHHMKESSQLLVLCAAMLAHTGFAQTLSTNALQESFDFLHSPQGTETVNKVRILSRACLGKVGVSNELVRVSTNTTYSLLIRQFAAEALATYDRSATNSYQEIEAFILTFPFMEEPPMTTNTISVMKRSLEIGSSAFSQFYNIQSDTNLPVLYRKSIGNTISNILFNTF